MSDYERFMKEESLDIESVFEQMHRDCPMEFSNIVK